MTTFLLCVGCQKGGTTWLSDYLRQAPEVRQGALKEMHVLNCHFFGPDWQERRIEMHEHALAALGPDEAKKRAELTELIANHRMCLELSRDLDAYARYYRDLAVDGVAVVADLTPAYALLTGAQWREVRAALERNGFDVKVIFLMRDPEGRLESAWRMRARNNQARGKRQAGALRRILQSVTGKGAPEEPYLDFATTGGNIERSRYELTIRAIEDAFPPEAIHYEFYETLFTPEAVSAINGFLGVPDRPADLVTRVNPSPDPNVISPAEKKKIRALLEPTYRFCAERFGEQKLRAIWKGF